MWSAVCIISLDAACDDLGFAVGCVGFSADLYRTVVVYETIHVLNCAARPTVNVNIDFFPMSRNVWSLPPAPSGRGFDVRAALGLARRG